MPLFLWTASASATGDATGGNLIAGVTFKPGLLYSVEQVSGGQTGGTLVLGVIQLVTRDAGLILQFAVSLTGSVISASHANPANLNWPIFRPDGTADAVLDHARANENLTVWTLDAWGYAWDLEANRSELGPQRP